MVNNTAVVQLLREARGLFSDLKLTREDDGASRPRFGTRAGSARTALSHGSSKPARRRPSAITRKPTNDR